MNLILLDLEWNGDYSRKAHGYFNEIIEIGAVKLNDALETLDRFHVVMKPVVSRRLTGIVKELTSITKEELDAEGVTFHEAVALLKEWIGGESTVLLTWSTTDLLVLLENCRFFLGDERIPFMEAFCDLQAYCQQRMETGNAQQLGLSKAAELLGIGEEGLDLHRALDDSVLAARVLCRVYDKEAFRACVRAADEEFYRRLTFKTVTIGDARDPRIPADSLQFRCEDCGRFLRRVKDWKFRSRALWADFVCGECGREYTARVQCRLKYEGMDIRRRLSDRIRPQEEQPGVRTAMENEMEGIENDGQREEKREKEGERPAGGI